MSLWLKKVGALATFAISSSLGCFAHHAGTPLDIEPVGVLPGYDRKLVVGVREPEIKLDPPIAKGVKAEPWTSLAELGRAISLIRSMRASGLYREVDFEGQLACAPDLLIEVHENPQLSSCDADAAMMLLYLGVIPVWYTCDQGHYFSRVDGKPKRFQFSWHETELFGWFMPLIDLLPGWTWKPPPTSRFDDAFRGFLLAHEAELLTGINADESASCPAN